MRKKLFPVNKAVNYEGSEKEENVEGGSSSNFSIYSLQLKARQGIKSAFLETCV